MQTHAANPDEPPRSPPPTATSSWWGRPAGAREVLAVATPLMVSALSWTVMTFVDRMMLFRVSSDAMAAAFGSGTAWFTLLCFPLGVCTYASTFVSQYHGAGRDGQIGPVTWQAVWVAVGFSPLLMAVALLAPLLFRSAGHTPEVTQLEVQYFRVLCWGIPPMLAGQALSGFYSGRGQTGVVMVVDSAFAAANLGLDWLWIFEHESLGLPGYGIEGAAWATVTALWLKLVAYGVLVTLPRFRHRYGTLRVGFNAALARRLLRFGGPSGLQMLLDVAGFAVFTLLCGRLQGVAFEATTMAFNISSLAFMPVWGMSLAASILVGQHLGENRDDLAARAAWTTFGLALCYMACVSTLYVLAPDLFLYGFFARGGGAVDRSAPVYQLAVTLLRFVAAYNLFDAAVMVFAGAIKGAGDTRFVLRVSVVMAVLLAGLSWVSVEVLRSVYACWAAITAWVWVVGVVFFLRFRGGKWRSMRVIEQSGATPPVRGGDGGASPEPATLA